MSELPVVDWTRIEQADALSNRDLGAYLRLQWAIANRGGVMPRRGKSLRMCARLSAKEWSKKEALLLSFFKHDAETVECFDPWRLAKLNPPNYNAIVRREVCRTGAAAW